MKKRFLFFSGLCLISIFCNVMHLHSLNEPKDFYGKTLYELKKEDEELKKALDESSRDLAWFNLISWLISPSDSLKETTKNHINFLEKKRKLIISCIKDAFEELKKLQQKANQPIMDTNAPDAVNVVFCPLFLFFAVTKEYEINEKKNQIHTTIETAKQIKKIIKNLNEILAED